MSRARKPGPLSSTAFILFALLFSLQCLPLVLNNSLTNDEAFEVTGGCYYWKNGDVITTRMQPPLAAALQTLPLLFTSLQWPHGFANADDRAYQFFFVSNPDKLETLTIAPRLAAMLFGLGIGWLIFIALRGGSPFMALCALGLWAFNPSLIAHSAIAKSDVPLAFLFMAAVLAFSRAQREPGWRQALLAGIVTGMAVTTKVTGLSLFPVYLLLELFHIKFKLTGTTIRDPLKRAGIVFGGTLLWIILIYLPGTLLLTDHRNPLSYFLDKVITGWKISQKGWAHYYFMGQTSDSGSLFYLPTAFLLKSTIPFLVLLALALFLWAARKIQLKPVEWVPPLLFILSVLPASNMGIRMMLPAFPFLFIIAARGAGWLWEGISKRSRKKSRGLLGALGFWLLLSLAFHYPNYLSYANETVSSEQKFFYIADSDLDWGQDTKRLSRLAQEKGWKDVKLAQFAGADPKFYGMSWRPWTENDIRGPQAGSTYLINASFFQLAPAFFPESAAIAHGWIASIPPTGRLGDTWYYYNIPGTPGSDNSPKIHSVPSLRYCWEGDKRFFY